MFEALTKLDVNARMLSVVGQDYHGDYILSKLPRENIHHIKKINNAITAQCTVVFDKHGECKLLLGNMDIFKQITPELVSLKESLL